MRRAQIPADIEAQGQDRFEQLGGDIYADDAEDLEEIRREADSIREDADAYADRINGRGDRHSIDMADE